MRDRGRAARLSFALLLLALPSVTPPAHAGATVTLIIDDLGYGLEQARRTLALPPPYAVAILPDTPYATRIARAAGAQGTDVLLHLPMTGNHDRAQGHHAIRRGMTSEQMAASLRDGFAAVPGAVAVNNHEGSVLTADGPAMARFMAALAALDGDYAFVDSRTTAASLARRNARLAGIATTQRDVFLDHDRSPEAIAAAVDHWLALARRQGCALAIAHPRPETLRVLEARMTRIDLEVERVDLRTYIERCGDRAG